MGNDTRRFPCWSKAACVQGIDVVAKQRNTQPPGVLLPSWPGRARHRCNGKTTKHTEKLTEKLTFTNIVFMCEVRGRIHFFSTVVIGIDVWWGLGSE